MRIPNVKFVQGRNSYTDRDGTKYGIAIHATANTAPASGEASYATRRTDGTSSHLYVDGVEVIQSLDLSARAGHAGSSTGNENAIAVEITGLNSWTRQQWIDRVAWDALGEALRFCCQTFGIAARHATVAEMRTNPKVKAFYTHNDMRLAWGGTDHTDPGPNFPMDVLLHAVAGGAPQGATMSMDSNDQDALKWRVEALVNGRLDVLDGPTAGEDVVIVRELLALKAQVADLAARPAAAVDVTALAAAILDGLPETALTLADVVEGVKQALRAGTG